jgi:hypothetical protein
MLGYYILMGWLVLQVLQILKFVPFYKFLLYYLGHVFYCKVLSNGFMHLLLDDSGAFVIKVQNYDTTDFSMVMYDLLPK